MSDKSRVAGTSPAMTIKGRPGAAVRLSERPWAQADRGEKSARCPPYPAASLTTELRSVPIPEISISIVSPCFMFAVAPSVPIQITSPG